MKIYLQDVLELCVFLLPFVCWQSFCWTSSRWLCWYWAKIELTSRSLEDILNRPPSRQFLFLPFWKSSHFWQLHVLCQDAQRFLKPLYKQTPWWMKRLSSQNGDSYNTLYFICIMDLTSPYLYMYSPKSFMCEYIKGILFLIFHYLLY